MFHNIMLKTEAGNPTATDALLKVITYPLAKIAEALGVQAIPAGQDIPIGLWISDGLPDSKAYNYYEFVDKLIAAAVTPEVHEPLPDDISRQ